MEGTSVLLTRSLIRTGFAVECKELLVVEGPSEVRDLKMSQSL